MIKEHIGRPTEEPHSQHDRGNRQLLSKYDTLDGEFGAVTLSQLGRIAAVSHWPPSTRSSLQEMV